MVGFWLEMTGFRLEMTGFRLEMIGFRSKIGNRSVSEPRALASPDVSGLPTVVARTERLRE